MPVNPGLHIHMKEPWVLEQLASAAQLCVPREHSSRSGDKNGWREREREREREKERERERKRERERERERERHTHTHTHTHPSAQVWSRSVITIHALLW